jgi:hypothetical protein
MRKVHVVGDESEQPRHVALGEGGQHVVDGVEGGGGVGHGKAPVKSRDCREWLAIGKLFYLFWLKIKN